MRAIFAAKLFEPVDGWSCGAVASGAGAAIASVGDVTMQLLGVPVPVLMGAVAGGFIGRAMSTPAPIWRALAMTFAWIVFGCVLAPLGSAAAAKFGVELAGGALAGIAGAIAALGPLLWPIVVEVLPGYVRAKFGGQGKGTGGNQSGGQP